MCRVRLTHYGGVGHELTDVKLVVIVAWMLPLAGLFVFKRLIAAVASVPTSPGNWNVCVKRERRRMSSPGDSAGTEPAPVTVFPLILAHTLPVSADAAPASTRMLSIGNCVSAAVSNVVTVLPVTVALSVPFCPSFLWRWIPYCVRFVTVLFETSIVDVPAPRAVRPIPFPAPALGMVTTFARMRPTRLAVLWD